MSMYNFPGHSNNYLKSSGSLWQYYRDEHVLDNSGKIFLVIVYHLNLSIMLPSIFEKQKICLNRTKSLLMVNPIFELFDWNNCYYLTSTFFLQFYKPQ